MSNHVKGCGCRNCRAGMHSKSGGVMVQKFIRRVRRVVKEMLRRGEEPPPAQSIGYTD